MNNVEVVAGNGLLHRRMFLQGGAAVAMMGYTLIQSASAQQLPMIRGAFLLALLFRTTARDQGSKKMSCERSAIPTVSRATSTHGRPTICSTAHSRRTAFTL